MIDEIKKSGIFYIKSGLSVIPVGKDKRPLIEWREFQTRRATLEEFLLWTEKFPEMQLGIVTGQISGIIVVDVDKPDLDISWLPETAVVRTGSGGTHWYYSFVSGFKNKARIKEFIDIRAEGGMVLAPPSENLKGKYTWLKQVQPQPFPVHLFQDVNEVSPTSYVAMQSDFPGYGAGQRNDQTARYVGHILAKLHPSVWDTIAWSLIQEANKKNTPPLPDYELRNTFNSIVYRERNSKTDRWYKQAEPSTVQTVESKLQIKNDYTDRYTWGTLGMDKTFAIIKRGNFIIVGAKQSQGKTTYTFDMACKNAMLGHKVLYLSLEMEGNDIKSDFARKYAGITVEEEYNYQVPEQKQIAYERKIKEIESIDRLIFKGMRRGDSLTWESIANIIKGYDDLDLIFLDNLDLIDGNRGENDVERQKNITKRIMNFTTEYKVPLILIHHHRKSQQGHDYGADELTGSGKIKDNADIILKIQRNTDPDAPYPEKYASRIYQQKGRGYPETAKNIFFIKGSFEDEAPEEEIKREQVKSDIQEDLKVMAEAASKQLSFEDKINKQYEN